VHSELLVEVNVLKTSLTDLKTKHFHLEDQLLREKAMIEQLEKRFEELKIKTDADHLESEKRKPLVHMFNLIRMYRKYYVEGIVGDWGRFCETYYKKEEDVFHRRIIQSDFDAYLKTFHEQLVSGITMSMIMKISDDRHAIAHHDIRSAANQQAFLTECATIDFIDSTSKNIALKLLPELAKVSLSRMK
jgi:hypothetical protein